MICVNKKIKEFCAKLGKKFRKLVLATKKFRKVFLCIWCLMIIASLLFSSVFGELTTGFLSLKKFSNGFSVQALKSKAQDVPLPNKTFEQKDFYSGDVRDMDISITGLRGADSKNNLFVYANDKIQIKYKAKVSSSAKSKFRVHFSNTGEGTCSQGTKLNVKGTTCEGVTGLISQGQTGQYALTYTAPDWKNYGSTGRWITQSFFQNDYNEQSSTYHGNSVSGVQSFHIKVFPEPIAPEIRKNFRSQTIYGGSDFQVIGTVSGYSPEGTQGCSLAGTGNLPNWVGSPSVFCPEINNKGEANIILSGTAPNPNVETQTNSISVSIKWAGKTVSLTGEIIVKRNTSGLNLSFKYNGSSNAPTAGSITRNQSAPIECLASWDLGGNPTGAMTISGGLGISREALGDTINGQQDFTNASTNRIDGVNLTTSKIAGKRVFECQYTIAGITLTKLIKTAVNGAPELTSSSIASNDGQIKAYANVDSDYFVTNDLVFNAYNENQNQNPTAINVPANIMGLDGKNINELEFSQYPLASDNPNLGYQVLHLGLKKDSNGQTVKFTSRAGEVHDQYNVSNLSGGSLTFPVHIVFQKLFEQMKSEETPYSYLPVSIKAQESLGADTGISIQGYPQPVIDPASLAINGDPISIQGNSIGVIGKVLQNQITSSNNYKDATIALRNSFKNQGEYLFTASGSQTIEGKDIPIEVEIPITVTRSQADIDKENNMKKELEKVEKKIESAKKGESKTYLKKFVSNAKIGIKGNKYYAKGTVQTFKNKFIWKIGKKIISKHSSVIPSIKFVGKKLVLIHTATDKYKQVAKKKITRTIQKKKVSITIKITKSLNVFVKYNKNFASGNIIFQGKEYKVKNGYCQIPLAAVLAGVNKISFLENKLFFQATKILTKNG